MYAYDAAVEWGCSASPIKKACKAGRIPGAQLMKVPGRVHPVWQIPDGTPRPLFIKPRGIQYNKAMPVPNIDISSAVGEISSAEYVWKNQTKKTIGQIAKDLGVTSKRVTELFDLALSLFSAKEASA